MTSRPGTVPIGLMLLLLVALRAADAPGGTPVPPESRPRATEWPVKTTAERLFALRAPYSYDEAAKWLDTADVGREVKRARTRNDRRLIGIRGYTLIVPGVTNRDPNSVPPGFSVVAIEGTSDSLEGGGQDRFQEKLMWFAERYNSGLLELRLW
jgi:hypothetical protein